MSEPPKHLRSEELEDIVETIRDILWPQGKEGEPWSPDTIDQIASVLDEYHLRPFGAAESVGARIPLSDLDLPSE